MKLIAIALSATAALMLALPVEAAAIVRREPPRAHHHPYAHHHHHWRHKAAWAGAGFAAGRIAGPAGSVGVGAAKYRKDLKAGGHRRTRAMAKIGAPVAAGAVLGPVGTAGYEGYEQRHWIKRHMLHMSHDRSRAVPKHQRRR